MFHTRTSKTGPHDAKYIPLNTRARNLPPRPTAWAPSYAWPANSESLMEPNEIRRHTELNSTRNQQAAKRSEIGICTKYTLFVENSLLFVLGAAFTSLGSYILYLKEKSVRDAMDFFFDPSCDMCLFGCILLVMGFLGLYGSLRENMLFLKIYYYLLIIFLVCELLLCVMIFTAYFSSDVKKAIFPKDAFDRAIKNYRDDIDMQNLIDGLQTEMQCCGMSDDEEGFMDWNENAYFNCSKSNQSPERCSVPSSCCKPQSGELVNHQCGWKAFKLESDGSVIANNVDYISKINTGGCMKSLVDWVNEHALVVGGVLLGILLPQMFITMFTANLIKMIKLQKSRWTK